MSVRRSPPSAQSLSTPEDFRAVYRTGRRQSTALGTIYVAPRQDQMARIGIPAGRRLGGAVVRNRLRRRVKEAFRSVRPRMHGGADLVIVPKTAALIAPLPQLVTMMEEALVEAGVPLAESLVGGENMGKRMGTATLRTPR